MTSAVKEETLEVWRRWLAKTPSVFDRTVLPPNRFSIPAELDRHLPRAQGSLEGPYLPIEYFRGETSQKLLTRDAVRIFKSSGTTATDRSSAPFSAVGLELYRIASVRTFKDVLRAVSDATEMQGISLIPPVGEWPDSSLAQMVTWISEELPVRYAADPAEVLEGLDRPVWLFGTGFHFVNLMNSGRRWKLPPGSVVIETGGTKGKSRSVTRAELHQGIADAFSLSPDSIISEYGMAELASQAYEFVDRRHQGEPRAFRFPAWVDTYVCTGCGKFGGVGEGALTIDDPMRVDIVTPIRTEDVVNLDMGSFRLLRRLEKAPLKGCSLRVENFVAKNAAAVTEAKIIGCNGSKKPATLLDSLNRFFRDTETPALLERDVGDLHAAEEAIADLIDSLPIHEEDFRRAAEIAFEGAPRVNGKWLFIAPDNHPIASIYPLAIAALRKVELTVRVPYRFSGDGFFRRFLKLLREYTLVSTLSSDYRIETSTDLPKGTRVLVVFGTDFTISRLAEIVNVPVLGFGDRLTVNATTVGELKTNPYPVIRDLFSLGQQGCRSSRLLFLQHESPLTASTRAELARRLSNAFLDFWKTPLSLSANLQLELARCATFQDRLPFETIQSDHPPLIRWIDLDEVSADERGIVGAIAAYPFVCSIVCTDSIAKVVDQVLSTKFFTTVACSPQIAIHFENRQGATGFNRQIALVSEGKANQEAWDGTTVGGPLFHTRQNY